MHCLTDCLARLYCLFLLPVSITDSEWKLLVITQARRIGRLPPSGGMVYCIEKVSMITLSVEKTVDEINMEVKDLSYRSIQTTSMISPLTCYYCYVVSTE